MNKRLFSPKRPGQSIPLIALIIVVLFGMVGLAVDVGNTYAQQRSAVRATEAATLSGMSTLLETNSDSSVLTAIKNSLKSNGINLSSISEGVALTSDNRQLTADYLGTDGNYLCHVGACTTDFSKVAYLQVKIDGFTSTYFAKVLGRDTLPIHAQAWAGKCAPTTGVYPIAIGSQFLDDDHFKPPTDPNELDHYGLYSDENYQQKYQRRIYQSEAVGTSGGFGYVRWKSDNKSGSEPYTADGLTGDGNMDLGFEEAPWPSGTSEGAEPNGYPVRPGALNGDDSDWIYANTGVMNGLEPQLQKLIDDRTRMYLPIIDNEAGSGANAEYHVARMGAFILRGYGNEPSKGKYFDFVYVGDASPIACNITNIVQTSSLGLAGTVFLRPVYTVPPLAHQPVEYTIVLDTSGSMAWNFYGEAKSGSTTLQCGDSSDPTRHTKFLQDGGSCNTNPSPKWSPQSERRVAIAKTAIQNFVSLLETYDAMQVIYFSGAGVGASTTGWQYGTTTGKTALNDAVLAAGAPSAADPYNVSGGTPSATGLYQARQIIAASPDTSTDGRTFKKVVIFLTDGVANYFRDTRNPSSGSKVFGWFNDSSDNASCKYLSGASETPSCQIGMTNTNPSFERPITAMASEAAAIKNLEGGTVLIYVIALAGVPSTGLSTEVASSSTFPYYSEAVQGSQVQDIFDAINQSVENPTCVPAGGISFIGSVDGTHTITNSSSRTGLGLPADTNIYGYVYLQNQYGTTLDTAPITHQNGQLSYTFSNVAPGTYQLAAFVGYLGDDTPTHIARSYSSILGAGLSHSPTQQQPVSSSGTLNSVVPALPLYLDLNGHVCP